MSTGGIVVREARSEEAEDIASCYEWLFTPPGMRPRDWELGLAIERLERTIGADSSAVLIGISGVRIVGICTAYIDLLSVRFGLRCWVEDLAVDPTCRSRGIGTKLLAAARRWAAAHGASHLELDSGDARTDAHRFYEREGANVLSRSFGWHGLGEGEGR